MKYIEEAEAILKEFFFENWMDDEDWKSFLIELQKASGVTLTSLSKDIETGVKNGYSLEKQKEILKIILNKNQ